MAYLPQRKRAARYSKRLYPVVLLFLAVILFITGFFAKTNEVSAGEQAKWPQEGEYVYYKGDLVVDLSHISQGYFLARIYYETSTKLKLRITVNGTTLDYDLPGNAQYIVVPLQMGSAYYEATLYENLSGKKYIEAGTAGFYAELEREDIAFLYPNQYVDYTQESAAVETSDEMNAGSNADETFSSVHDFLLSGFVYDFIKAMNIKPSMLPDIDGSFDKHMGVCQDLSAIVCCMLRTQGIPARLIIGYADNSYHAWVVATVNGEHVFFDPTASLNAINPPKEYSVERYY